MNRVWLGTLGTIALMVSAPACIAVLDWDYEAASGEGGNGGMGISSSTASTGSGGSGGAIKMSSSGSTSSGSVSSSSSSSSSSGNGGAGGMMNPCPGCTYGARFGDDQAQTLLSMALSNDGNLFFSGYYDGELRLDASNAVQDTVGKSTQPFLAKLDRAGKPQWITNPLDYKTTGGDGSNVVIANGKLAWTGSIQNGMPGFDTGLDTFVEIRDVNGGRDTTLVRKFYGSALDDGLRSSALSPDGQTLYLAGAVVGQANAGTFANCPTMPAFNTVGEQNIMMLAIDTATGNCLWGRTWTGGNHLAGSISVTTGSDGTPFISGHFVSGTITNNNGFTFPAVPTVQAPKYGAVGFILKVNRLNGALLAAKGYAHAGFVAMTSDTSTGTIVGSGALVGPNVTFKGMTIPGATASTDGADNVILAFDENLNEKWAQITGGPDNQFCPGISSDGVGRFYAACVTLNKIDRGAVVDCGSSSMCSVLLPIQSATGTLIANQIKVFGTEPFNTMGKTFVSAATPAALAVGGTWIDAVQFWDGTLLNTTGSSSTDYDIAVGKVEPLP